MTDEQQAEIIQRFKEAIALDHVIPFRVIPRPTPDTQTEGAE